MDRDVIIKKIDLVEAEVIKLEESCSKAELLIEDGEAEISNLKSALVDSEKTLKGLNNNLEQLEILLSMCEDHDEKGIDNDL